MSRTPVVSSAELAAFTAAGGDPLLDGLRNPRILPAGAHDATALRKRLVAIQTARRALAATMTACSDDARGTDPDCELVAERSALLFSIMSRASTAAAERRLTAAVAAATPSMDGGGGGIVVSGASMTPGAAAKVHLLAGCEKERSEFAKRLGVVLASAVDAKLAGVADGAPVTWRTCGWPGAQTKLQTDPILGVQLTDATRLLLSIAKWLGADAEPTEQPSAQPPGVSRLVAAEFTRCAMRRFARFLCLGAHAESKMPIGVALTAFGHAAAVQHVAVAQHLDEATQREASSLSSAILCVAASASAEELQCLSAAYRGSNVAILQRFNALHRQWAEATPAAIMRDFFGHAVVDAGLAPLIESSFAEPLRAATTQQRALLELCDVIEATCGALASCATLRNVAENGSSL